MIKETLTTYVGSIEKIWSHDRQKTVGASEIGKCARQVFWAKRVVKKRGEKPESTGWGARTRGTIMEDQFWVPALKARFGKDLVGAGEDQKSLIAEPLSSTPDGILINRPRDFLKHLGVDDIGPSRCILVECKTIDPRANLREVKMENEFQVQVQLGIVRKTTKYKPDYALISYTDASFWDEVKEFVIKYDPAKFEAANARANKIFKATHPTELEPEGWIAGGGDCEYCPFTKECGITRRSVPTAEVAADPQFAAEISDMARDVQDRKDALEADEARLRVAEQALKDRLREKGVRKVDGVVVWSYVKGRQSYDNKAIREAAAAKGIDLEEYSTAGEPTDRLQILLSSRQEDTSKARKRNGEKQQSGSEKQQSGSEKRKKRN